MLLSAVSVSTHRMSEGVFGLDRTAAATLSWGLGEARMGKQGWWKQGWWLGESMYIVVVWENSL